MPTISLILLATGSLLIAANSMQEPDTSQRSDSTVISLQPVETGPGINSWISIKNPQFIATLLGSFLASLIAVYSVNATYKRGLKRDAIAAERTKQINQSRYCGLIFALHSIVQNHGEMATKIRSEISSIRDTCLDKKALIIDGTSTRFQLSFMEQCVLKILEFEGFQTRLLGNFITYQHSLANLNANLDFSHIRTIEQNFQDKSLFLEALNEYFNSILRTIERHDEVRTLLKTMIVDELKGFPMVDIKGLPPGVP